MFTMADVSLEAQPLLHHDMDDTGSSLRRRAERTLLPKAHQLSSTSKSILKYNKEDLEKAVDSGSEKKPLYRPGPEYDDDIPYGGLVYLARRKKPDGLICIGIQVVVILAAVGFSVVAYYQAEYFHFHITKFYAHIGHPHAQHVTAQKYLHDKQGWALKEDSFKSTIAKQFDVKFVPCPKGKGIERNHTEAMAWFRKAADQGHPHAAYNLAVGRMKGMHKDTYPGEVHDLIRHAAANGVEEAQDVLHHVCSKGNCDI